MSHHYRSAIPPLPAVVDGEEEGYPDVSLNVRWDGDSTRPLMFRLLRSSVSFVCVSLATGILLPLQGVADDWNGFWTRGVSFKEALIGVAPARASSDTDPGTRGATRRRARKPMVILLADQLRYNMVRQVQEAFTVQGAAHGPFDEGVREAVAKHLDDVITMYEDAVIRYGPAPHLGPLADAIVAIYIKVNTVEINTLAEVRGALSAELSRSRGRQSDALPQVLPVPQLDSNDLSVLPTAAQTPEPVVPSWSTLPLGWQPLPQLESFQPIVVFESPLPATVGPPYRRAEHTSPVVAL